MFVATDVRGIVSVKDVSGQPRLGAVRGSLPLQTRFWKPIRNVANAFRLERSYGVATDAWSASNQMVASSPQASKRHKAQAAGL